MIEDWHVSRVLNMRHWPREFLSILKKHILLIFVFGPINNVSRTFIALMVCCLSEPMRCKTFDFVIVLGSCLKSLDQNVSATKLSFSPSHGGKSYSSKRSLIIQASYRYYLLVFNMQLMHELSALSWFLPNKTAEPRKFVSFIYWLST